jgi:hypothetical protein
MHYSELVLCLAACRSTANCTMHRPGCEPRLIATAMKQRAPPLSCSVHNAVRWSWPRPYSSCWSSWGSWAWPLLLQQKLPVLLSSGQPGQPVCRCAVLRRCAQLCGG